MFLAKRGTISATITLCFLSVALSRAFAQAETPQSAKGSSASQRPAAPKEASQEDPFADLAPAATPQEAPKEPERSWARTFLTENFGFRKEIMSQFDIDENGQAAGRQSVGFELLKKFSTATSTVASFNFQGRLVRRDRFNPVLNDIEGEERRGWAFEYHNLYLDF